MFSVKTSKSLPKNKKTRPSSYTSRFFANLNYQLNSAHIPTEMCALFPSINLSNLSFTNQFIYCNSHKDLTLDTNRESLLIYICLDLYKALRASRCKCRVLLLSVSHWRGWDTIVRHRYVDSKC